MMRLLFFLCLALWCVVALMPLRMGAWREERAGHTVNATRRYLESVKAYRALGSLDFKDDHKARVALDYAHSLVLIRRFLDAEAVHAKVISARKSGGDATKEYDRLLAEALSAQGHGRISMGDVRSASVSFDELVNYNKTHLQKDDPILIRDQNNLGVVSLLIARSTPDPRVRAARLKKAIEYFKSARDSQKRARGADTVAEANILQNMADALYDLDMTEEANQAMLEARRIVAPLNRPCREL